MNYDYYHARICRGLRKRIAALEAALAEARKAKTVAEHGIRYWETRAVTAESEAER